MEIKDILMKLNAVFTDQKIADKVGCSQPTICRLRNGITKHTFDHTAQRIRVLFKKTNLK